MRLRLQIYGWSHKLRGNCKTVSKLQSGYFKCGYIITSLFWPVNWLLNMKSAFGTVDHNIMIALWSVWACLKIGCLIPQWKNVSFCCRVIKYIMWRSPGFSSRPYFHFFIYDSSNFSYVKSILTRNQRQWFFPQKTKSLPSNTMVVWAPLSTRGPETYRGVCLTNLHLWKDTQKSACTIWGMWKN